MSVASPPSTERFLPHGHRPVARPARFAFIEHVIGADPGLNRLLAALHSVAAIAIILEVELLFVAATHALLLKAPASHVGTAAATVAAANHEYLVIAELLGAIVGMISTFSVMDVTAKGQLISMLLLPVPMIPALALGLAIGGHRTPALVLLAVLLAAGTYLRRFGPRGFAAGLLLFMGYFLGFFLHAGVTLSDLGWLSAEIGVGIAVATLVRFTLFYPHPARALRRTQRSYGARARAVAATTLELFDDPAPSDGRRRRLHRQLVRLNEAALMIDAQLGDPTAVPEGSSAQQLHQHLFDVELALTNVARLTVAMADLEIARDQRGEIGRAVQGLIARDAVGARAHANRLRTLVASSDEDGVSEDRTAVFVVHRFAGAIDALASALEEWSAHRDRTEAPATFTPSVMLLGGWLPGSAQVSTTASLENGGHVRLAPYSRTAIQMGIAVGAATLLGVQLSSYRFYWALIAAFVTFMGANNAAEQARKAFFRVAGTVVGIGIGSLLVDAVGKNADGAVAVILVALFFGFYLMRVNYAFMVVGITVMVSQLYVQLGEFSNALLLLRLEETAIGAAVAMIVATTILPLRTRYVLRVALRAYVEVLGELVTHATDLLLGTPGVDEAEVRSDARALDVAYQALVATAAPLQRNLSGGVDTAVEAALRLSSASRHYAKNLAVDAWSADPLDVAVTRDLAQARQIQRRSLEAVLAAMAGIRGDGYTRCAALLDRAECHLEAIHATPEAGQLAIRDLKLADATLARMAEVEGLAITDIGLSPPPPAGSIA